MTLDVANPDGNVTRVGFDEADAEREKTAELQADIGQMRAFANAIFKNCLFKDGGFVSLRAFEHEVPQKIVLNKWVPYTKELIASAAKEATTIANRPYAQRAVFSPPVCIFRKKTNAAEDNVQSCPAIAVELDARPRDALAMLEGIFGPPTIVIASGGLWKAPDGTEQEKLHVYWRLTAPATTSEDLALLKQVRQRAADIIAGADGSGAALVHPMRWPGSWHIKTKTPRLCRIVNVADDVEIDLQQALRAIEAATPAEIRPQRTAGERTGFKTKDAWSAQDLETAAKLIPNVVLAWHDWSRIGMAFYDASHASDEGLEAFHAWSEKSDKYDPGHTDDRWEHWGKHPPSDLSSGTLLREIRNAGSTWVPTGAEFFQELGPERHERPVIEIVAGELDAITTAAEDALIAAKLPLFERGQRLVCLGAKGVEIITTEGLLDKLSGAASFQKRDKSGKPYPFDPPRQVADILRSRRGARFRPLAGIISTPTLRSDGSVLDKPGYDEKTGLFLMKPPQMPAIPERPSEGDAKAALNILLGLLVEFPFKTDADKAVALSGLITPVVRGALSVAPMHAIRAPIAGSGKSYLVDLVCLIATGRDAPVVSVVSIAEMDKTLTGCLTEGRPIIPIDNVSIELDSDLLNQAISQPVIALRRLGKSDVYEIENKVCIFATGNNLQIANDSTRRVVVCNLDANTEQPEHRIFDGKPDAAIRADRGRYIAAALTIVRAYVVAGYPGVLPSIGSFGDWSRMVRSALVWLDCADPVLTMRAARADDPSREGRARVLSAWEKFVGLDVFLLAGELCLKVKENADFRDAVSAAAGDDRGHFESRQLAGWLVKNKDRIADGLKIVNEKDLHGKQNRWGVVAVAGAATAK